MRLKNEPYHSTIAWHEKCRYLKLYSLLLDRFEVETTYKVEFLQSLQ